MGHRRRAARHHPAGTGGPAQAGRVSGCPRRAGVPPPSRGAPAAPRPADAGGPQRPAGDGRGAQRHRRGGVGGRLVWRPTRPPPAPRVGGGHGGAGNAPPPLGTRGRHAGGTRRSPRPGGCSASRTALGTSASSAPCARGAKRACGKMGRGDSRRQGRPKGAGPVRCWPSFSLHEVCDRWAAQGRRRHARGEGIIVRDGDAGRVGGQHRDAAEPLLSERRERCHRGPRALPPAKTRLSACGRSARERRQRRGPGTPEPVAVLGVPHRCGPPTRGQSPVRECRTPGSGRAATRRRTRSWYDVETKDLTCCAASRPLPSQAARAP